ncbi:ATP-dependent helicase [Aquibacillus albus]|uniref:DNA 3'-5' helicase n=1 Tax=Aquibacillus albus TaxID=1168171 RepID=A0ABS2N3Y1_9BACI|nr:ATP-dependent helicase [Aquibacillus albus]MBM7572753.1 DNA helicase-2/ATP-dependent DNA helicase PcrA [Aquibacillus albus]
MIKTDTMLRKLNNYQKDAVLDNSPALLLNAHVGSGKTTVLISKVMYLRFVKAIDLKDMVVLTFTNKAAKEIKDRIKTENSEIKDKDMPYFGTFHHVASKLLSQSLPVEDIGYTSDFTIMDPDELMEMAYRLMIEHRFNIKFKNKLPNRIEAIKNGITLYGNMKREDDMAALWECMVEEKQKQNKMDFDDLIINATKLLKIGLFTPKWIIIDEFQDCNAAQLAFMKEMCGTDTKLFVVGDPNQIIYSWRGSEKNIFTTFKQTYDAKEMTLPINYRSSSTILDAAKQFLADSSELEGVREEGNKIVVKNHYNPFNEAKYLCDQIKNLQREAAVNYRDIAIFYRTQRQSKTIEDALVKERIPVEVSMKKSLKDVPVLRWFVSLLKASINSNDKNNIITALNNKEFGEGLSFAKIRGLWKSEDSSVLLDKIIGFEAWCNPTKVENISEIYDYFELDNYLSPTSSTYLENKTFILDFIDSMKHYIDDKKLALTEGMLEYLNSSTLYGLNILKDSIDVEDDSVKLMTLHACKGLEFNHVFIVGANDGLIPLRSSSTEAYEEEKRLFFVGITRAKDDLEISYYTNPDNYRVLEGPSDFVYMLPSHLVAKEESKARLVDLQSIRKEIQENQVKSAQIQESTPIEGDDPEEKSSDEKRVKHEKYGEGIIESEDADSITVIFDAYGSKTFSKFFTTLEYLS